MSPIEITEFRKCRQGLRADILRDGQIIGCIVEPRWKDARQDEERYEIEDNNAPQETDP